MFFKYSDPVTAASQEPRVENYRWKYPNWPATFTVNSVHLWVEYVYEFLRGARMATDNQLTLCEVPLSKYLESS